MREYGLTILVAAAVTYLLTPLVRRFAIAVGALHAARARDVHTEPVPLVGGLAMYLGLAAALLVASRLTHLSTVFVGTRVASGLLLAGGVVVVLGFVDDRWGLGAITKMAGQVAAGVILVWSGAVVAWLPVPGGGTLSLTSDQQTVLTILVVVVTINAVNFIDGLDGLAAGIVGIGAAAFFLYYYTLTKRLGLDDQTGPALASAILAGVCLGFLPHNFHPARIFMGDTGSMLLGLLLAYVPISSLASLDPNTLTSPSAYSGGTVNRFPEILPLLVPAIIMLIPYADLLLAVVRRTRAGQSPFSADKKHLQHRLLAIGHSHRASVLIMYLWAVLFAGTVVLLSIIRTKLLVLGLVTLAGVLILLLASMPRLRPWNRRGQLRLAPDVAGPVPAGARCLRVQRCLRVRVPPWLPVWLCLGAGAGWAALVPGWAGVFGSGAFRRAGASGHSIPPPVPAAAGTAAQGRRRADRGASLDRGRACGPRAWRRRRGWGGPWGVRPDRSDAGIWDMGTRPVGTSAYRDPLRGDAGYEDPLRGDAGVGMWRTGIRCAAMLGTGIRCAMTRRTGTLVQGGGAPTLGGTRGVPGRRGMGGLPSQPGPPNQQRGIPARPARRGTRDRPRHRPKPQRPPRPFLVPEALPPRPTVAGCQTRLAAGSRASGTRAARIPAAHGSGPQDSGRTDPGLTGSAVTDPGLTGSGWTDPGRQDSGQWYSGRPEPSQWDSGRWDSRPHDAGSRHASAQGADLEDTGLEDWRSPGPQLAGPRPAGPQPAKRRSARRRSAGHRPAHPGPGPESAAEAGPRAPGAPRRERIQRGRGVATLAVALPLTRRGLRWPARAFTRRVSPDTARTHPSTAPSSHSHLLSPISPTSHTLAPPPFRDQTIGVARATPIV